MPTFSAAPSPHTSEANRWLTLGQACRMLAVDESTLRRWADAGQVHTFRTPGGHRRFAEGDVLQIMARTQTPFADVGDLATRRIRQQLNRSQDEDWYATVDPELRDRLRPLGRRLMALVAEYLARKSRRTPLLAEARTVGAAYGGELVVAQLTLSQAIQAFTFFRRHLDQSAKQALARNGTAPSDVVEVCEQIMVLADAVLVGIASAYEPQRGGSA